jgi:MHS family proline/betaine transporter-like MFS transporter
MSGDGGAAGARHPGHGGLPAGAAGPVTIVDTSTLRRTIAATAVGNMVEWFDFGVFSYIAVTLGKVFFPEASGPVQLISTFATFAAAFLVRPLGGLFFGPLADRDVRRRAATRLRPDRRLGPVAAARRPASAGILHRR